MASNLRQFAKKLTEQLEIMAGKEKGNTDDLIGEIVTINDFDFLKGENGEYAVFTVKEHPGTFYFGGQVLTDDLQQIGASGMLPEVQKEGLPALMSKKRAKESNRYYTNVIFYPEDK